MDITHAILLALVQGITEFLPISSTAHLILVPYITGWPDQGLAFDVTLNTATWLAVVIYFRKDIVEIIQGFFRSVKERRLKGNHNGELAWMVGVGTIPVLAAGILLHDKVAHEWRTLEVIGWSSVAWGVVLWVADRKPGGTDIKNMSWAAAMFIGIAQAIALVPGTSRSGITMTGGLFMGLSRTASARFSYLLAIVVGFLAGGKEGYELVKTGFDAPWLSIVAGFVVAFVSAYLVIHYFMKLLSRSSMTPFVVYRVLLGAVVLGYAYKFIA